MKVVPFKPIDERIAAAVAAERRRNLLIIEEVNAHGQHLSAHVALCLVHTLIRKLSEGRAA